MMMFTALSLQFLLFTVAAAQLRLRTGKISEKLKDFKEVDERPIEEVDNFLSSSRNYQKCGGQDYTGDISCPAGYFCDVINTWHHQCNPNPTQQPINAHLCPTAYIGKFKQILTSHQCERNICKEQNSVDIAETFKGRVKPFLRSKGTPFPGLQEYSLVALSRTEVLSACVFDTYDQREAWLNFYFDPNYSNYFFLKDEVTPFDASLVVSIENVDFYYTVTDQCYEQNNQGTTYLARTFDIIDDDTTDEDVKDKAVLGLVPLVSNLPGFRTIGMAVEPGTPTSFIKTRSLVFYMQFDSQEQADTAEAALLFQWLENSPLKDKLVHTQVLKGVTIMDF